MSNLILVDGLRHSTPEFYLDISSVEQQKLMSLVPSGVAEEYRVKAGSLLHVLTSHIKAIRYLSLNVSSYGQMSNQYQDQDSSQY